MCDRLKLKNIAVMYIKHEIQGGKMLSIAFV